MPAAPAPATASRLLKAPDQRALRRAVLGEPLGLVIGTADARQADQAEERRKIDGARHPGKSEAAAAAALSITGPGSAKKSRIARLLTAMMPFITHPVERSSDSTGSSKYMTLMMRR